MYTKTKTPNETLSTSPKKQFNKSPFSLLWKRLSWTFLFQYLRY